MSQPAYVHGYSAVEAARLADQAQTLADVLHEGVRYPAGAMVLEAGCGVGAQTVRLAAASPEARFISVDISTDSLAQARRAVAEAGLDNVTFMRANLLNPPFADESFDHVFVCFVLEHLAEPLAVLRRLRRLLRPGGQITVIEGDHGSCYFHPESAEAMAVWRCLIQAQAAMGGDSLIGRRLHPLLAAAGFNDVRVRPALIYADESLPHMVEGFTRRTIMAMVAGVEGQAKAMGLIDDDAWRRGMAALGRAAEPGGVFNYSFFRATAYR